MKKYLMVIFIVFSFLVPRIAYAEERQMKELIPITEVASVETIKYYYHDISYTNQVEKEIYGLLKIKSVYNKSRVEMPLAVDILLFNEQGINIGFIAYCTTKDLAGEYAQQTVNAGGSEPLTVFVDSSYLVSGHTKDEIAYYSVLDDNDKCYVGNSNKYGGLTIEEIIAGKTSPDWNENDVVNVFSFILNVGIYTFILILLAIIFLYVVFAALINQLSKKMFEKKVKMRYVPIVNFVISVNLAFGRVMGFFVVLGIAGSIYLIITQHNWFFCYVTLGVILFSIIINILKLLTKKYDLLFFDPFLKNDGSNPALYWKKVRVTGKRKAQQILNLDYSDKDLKRDLPSDVTHSSIDFTPVNMAEIESKEQILNKLEAAAPKEPEGPVFAPVGGPEKKTEKPKLEKLDDGSPTILSIPGGMQTLDTSPVESTPATAEVPSLSSEPIVEGAVADNIEIPSDFASFSDSVENSTPESVSEVPMDALSTESDVDNVDKENDYLDQKNSQEEFMDMFR